MNTSLLEAALELAARGFPIFPLQPRSKEPYKGSRGFLDATTDPAQINDWWSKAPDSNVGFAVPDGIVVVDMDPRHGGEATLASLEAQHGPFPETLTVRTGRGDGGLHALYRLEAGFTLPSKLGDGVDVKQLGGYLVAPPSIHPDSGQPYTWLDTRPMADAPAWLVALARPRAERGELVVVDEDERMSDDAAVARVAAVVEPHFVRGRMHDICKNLGGWMKQRGFGFADAAAVVRLLPCRNVKNGLDAARAAFAIDKPFGWQELQGLIGATAAAELDAIAPNPKREREAADLAALRAMMPAQALAAPPSGPPAAAAASSTLVERLRRRPVAIFESVLSTGVPALDSALTFGGVPVSKNIVIGGAPDAGKTAMARQMAEAMAAAGAAVAWVAVDEDADDIDSRRLQALGFPRHIAAAGVGPGGLSEADVERVERELGRRAFHVFENVPVEDAFAELARLYPDRLRVVVIDSLQTAHSRRSLAASSPRERIDTLIADVKAAQLAYPALWIATSELARAAYRNREQSENVDPLAAAKESGAIEYAAKLLLVLRSEGDDVVSVEVPKNKLGSKAPLRLRLDRATLDFHSAPGESVSEHDAKVLAAIVQALTPKEGDNQLDCGLGLEQLKSRVRNAGAAFRNGTFRDLCERLLEQGTLERYGRGGYQLRRQGGRGQPLPPLPESLASMAAALAPKVPEAAP